CLVLSSAGQEAGHEIFDRPWLAVHHRKEDHPISRGDGAVPRSVKRDKSAVAIPRWKPRAGVERDANRGRMRRQQYIRHDGAADEIGKRSDVLRIVVTADVG